MDFITIAKQRMSVRNYKKTKTQECTFSEDTSQKDSTMRERRTIL